MIRPAERRAVQHMQVKKILFRNYKAFQNFTVNLSKFDVLVGPNNSGKSTVLSSFRLLAEGIRKAKVRKAEIVSSSDGDTWGYVLDLRDIPVSLENVAHDLDKSAQTSITFFLDNDGQLELFFPTDGGCHLIPRGKGMVNTPMLFNKNYQLDVRTVPILGPVEHREEVYQKEAARLALLTTRASRNFRNIWYRFPEGFERFREMIKETWPGMDIQPPVMLYGDGKPFLAMFCPEENIPREIFWAGFGFQIWCQLLTYILQANKGSILIIDEPDIYLHSDLQRQLVQILQSLDIQVLLATHSVEIITEVETGSILTIQKKRKTATRITNIKSLQNIFQQLGSNANPILTQIAKTRRALFLEGKDFQIISMLARRAGFADIANRSDFAVIAVGGFNPKKVKDFSHGIEVTLGSAIAKGVIFDKDFRNDLEVQGIIKELEQYCDFAIILARKEIENFLLVPSAIGRAINQSLKNKLIKNNQQEYTELNTKLLLEKVASLLYEDTQAMYLAKRKEYFRINNPKINDVTVIRDGLEEFKKEWSTLEGKLKTVPGKEALSKLNELLQQELGISLTIKSIIDSFNKSDIDNELKDIFLKLKNFSLIIQKN